ncbi:urease accessory protein UreD [Jannaschia sp. S6380]|uniref:urease accessory protein UreD n=1 Tax=Jannaschia sp. S6380 TaxID=2926408 RepID=UPI001FF17E10|nr:urease accessory protein UreD [Jannaschia sp. S6380]MCK0167351.1 urease accessory protein UreD [Jannaschia sp. S6380]
MAELGQSGCLKALMPRNRVEAVIVNTSGGITSGDRLEISAEAGAGAELNVTTQACERLYRAPGGPAHLDVALEAKPDAHLAWLPQETIAYDGARLRRRIEVDVDPSATLILCESVILGRAAMGERLRRLDVAEQWRVRRGGVLIHAEELRLGPPEALAGAALLNGAGALATVMVVAPDAAARLSDMRRALAPAGSLAGAAAWDGKVLARVLALDGLSLRRILIPLLRTLVPVPRVWLL